MNFTDELQSNSSPKIKKAAKRIIREKLTGYGSQLLDALKSELMKPRAWQAQCALLDAIAHSEYKEAIPFIKELCDEEFEATTIYIHIGFALAILEPITNTDLSVFWSIVEKGNISALGGVCMAMYYKKITPSNDEAIRIIEIVSKHTENEGQIITPRCYIAACAFSWKKSDEVVMFLESCKESTWAMLGSIAESSMEGKDYKWKPW